MLGYYEKSQLFCCHLKGFPNPRIITTIPPWSWKTTFRILARLDHQAGQLYMIADALAKRGVNILLMEGYGYHYNEERGWWSAVIDFPAFHGINKAAVRVEVRQLLEGIAALEPFKGTDVKELVRGDFNELDRLCLFAKDGKLRVSIEPMRLQELEIVEDPYAAPAYIVHRNTIDIPVDSGQEPGRYRNLMMCNTEERFIRLVEIQGPAEIDLVVHTEAEKIDKVGVGVLSVITKLLADFEPRDGDDNVLYEKDQKGANIAFTYNYITTYKVPRRRSEIKTSEASTIKLFLEIPSALSGRPEDVVRCCKKLFGELLNAKRDGERFVKSRKSKLILWQYGGRFRGDEGEPRGVVTIGPLRSAWDWLSAKKRIKMSAVSGLFFLLAAGCFALEFFFDVWYVHDATITFLSVAGVTLIEMLAKSD